MNCVRYVLTASWKLPHAHPKVKNGNSPCDSDVFPRYHIGTRKNTISHAMPGASSRYGIAPLRRCSRKLRSPLPAAAKPPPSLLERLRRAYAASSTPDQML